MQDVHLSVVCTCFCIVYRTREGEDPTPNAYIFGWHACFCYKERCTIAEYAWSPWCATSQWKRFGPSPADWREIPETLAPLRVVSSRDSKAFGRELTCMQTLDNMLCSSFISFIRYRYLEILWKFDKTFRSEWNFVILMVFNSIFWVKTNPNPRQLF